MLVINNNSLKIPEKTLTDALQAAATSPEVTSAEMSPVKAETSRHVNRKKIPVNIKLFTSHSIKYQISPLPVQTISKCY